MLVERICNTMIFLSLLIVNFFIVAALSVYLKSTCGINKCSKHMVGKVVIVTGANAGIGYETAKDLADRGARVIMGCRHGGRGTTARDEIIRATGNKDVHYRNLDLASLSSVKKFAAAILSTEKRLDVLINNAGVVIGENVKTEDGLLYGMACNHFGPFLLTNLLLPLLKQSAPSRIINVSSIGYRMGKIDFSNLNMEKETDKTFKMSKVYCNSKLCNILMTVELERRLRGTGVTANCLHPGMVATDIIKYKYTAMVKPIFTKFFVKSPWEGAQTQIYLAVSPAVSEVSGRYFADCLEQNTTKVAQDTKLAQKLWAESERLVKLNNNVLSTL